MNFILASASEARAKVLRGAGVAFAVEAAGIDEAVLKTELLSQRKTPQLIAAALAEAKAMQVSRANPGAIVLGADQILEFDGELVSKCADLAAARSLLRRLRTKSHRLISALCLAEAGKVQWAFSDTATLWMRRFSDDFLERYLSTEGAVLLTGVGCYRLEGRGAQLFERIEGDYFSILGLPLQPLLAELRRKGVIAS